MISASVASKVISLGEALDHLRNFAPDQVSAKELAGFGVKNGLHKPFRLPRSDGLAVHPEREAPTLTSWPAFLAFASVSPHRGDLRLSILCSRVSERRCRGQPRRRCIQRNGRPHG